MVQGSVRPSGRTISPAVNRVWRGWTRRSASGPGSAMNRSLVAAAVLRGAIGTPVTGILRGAVYEKVSTQQCSRAGLLKLGRESVVITRALGELLPAHPMIVD